MENLIFWTRYLRKIGKRHGKKCTEIIFLRNMYYIEIWHYWVEISNNEIKDIWE